MPYIVRGRNAYRQVRVTLTEETGGRFGLRIMVKPVGKEWTMRHSVYVRAWRMSDPPATLPDVLALLADEVARAGEVVLPS